MNATEKFRAAMRAASIDYTGPIIADGKLHRVKAGDDHDRNSWYVFHDGAPAAGAFGCWKRDIKETWCDCNGSLSQAEWDGVRQRWAEAEQTETDRHAKARALAAWILNRSRPARTLDRYLSRKGVKIFGDLRDWRGALVLPLRGAGGELHSLQFIQDDGTKRFLTGGRIAGCSFAMSDRTDGTLVVCEGYATGASIHEATGFAVVCAMHAGNLKGVADDLRKKFPGREIIVAADNDQFTAGNPGLTKATEAAVTICAKLAVPNFQDVSTKPTDFNDLHQLAGLSVVAQQIADAQPVPGFKKTTVELPEETDEPESAPFPLDALPSAMRDIIAGVARTERVPVALPAVCSLAVASAAIGAGLEITSGPNRVTRANLFFLASAESGSGKSETFRIIAAPLVDHQTRVIERWKVHTLPKIETEIGVLVREIKTLEGKAAKANTAPNEHDEMLADLESKRARKNKLGSLSSMPCIIAQDVTTERLAVLLRDNRELNFSASADARKLIENVMGRYNPGNSTDESLYLSAFSGDFVRVDRQGRETVILNRPCLSLCWFFQPDKMVTMLDEESLSASGFLARPLICHTNATPLRIEGVPQILAETVRQQWTQLIDDLLATFHAADKAHCITPTPEAVAILNGFYNRIVDRRGGDLADVGAFAARYGENAWRLSVVLHAAQWAGEAGHEPLSAETAANAVRVVEWFVTSQLDILAKGRRAAAVKVEDEIMKLLDDRIHGRRLDPEERKLGGTFNYVKARNVVRARITVTADAATALLAKMEANGLLEGEDITPTHGGKTTRIFRHMQNPVPE